MREIELLAPVGGYENALAAIENGADAIFVGGKLFGARYFANNFEDDELEKIVSYCKLRGVKTHITVNTLVKEEEFDKLLEYLAYLDRLQVDAVIVQDFGVAKIVREYFPHLVMHASTQMSAHSLEDVLFLRECGFERVVLARELQLKDITYIKENSGVEIESFIHGALCYAYSGQCLLSSMIGGRSGNRGRCDQTCRMTYTLLKNNEAVTDNIHLLSPKDIYTLAFLPELIASGIDSFKIEGRMKSPEYVAAVTSIYRKYIDLAKENPKNYKVDDEDLATLQSIFNRGGFSEGYYHQKSGKNMITEKTPKNIGLHIGHVVRYDAKRKVATFHTERALHPGDGLEIWNKKKHTGTGISKNYAKGETFTISVEQPVDEGSKVYLSKNHTLLKTLRKSYEKSNRKVNITGELSGKVGESLLLTLSYKGQTITCTGPVVTTAENRPVSSEEVVKRLSKMGNTSFKMENLAIHWPENAYVNIAELNGLRRDAVEQLEKIICSPRQTNDANYKKQVVSQYNGAKSYCVQISTLKQLNDILAYSDVESIYWEWQYDDELTQKALEKAIHGKRKFYLILPAIFRDKEWKKYKEQLKKWETSDLTGYVIRNYGSFLAVSHTDKEKVIDFSLNVMNNESIAHWVEKGATLVTPSLELSRDELTNLGGPLEKIIYGHIPVMTSEQCVIGNYHKCQKQAKEKGQYTLLDRKDAKWPIHTDCVACKMQILSDKPIFIDPRKDLDKLPFMSYRMIFIPGEDVKPVLEHVFKEGCDLKETQLGIYLKPID